MKKHQKEENNHGRPVRVAVIRSHQATLSRLRDGLLLQSVAGIVFGASKALYPMLAGHWLLAVAWFGLGYAAGALSFAAAMAVEASIESSIKASARM